MMSRYYFDIDDDRLSTIDQEGEEFPAADAARRCAIFTAASLAKDSFLKGSSQVTVSVRTDNEPVFVAKIVLTTVSGRD